MYVGMVAWWKSNGIAQRQITLLQYASALQRHVKRNSVCFWGLLALPFLGNLWLKSMGMPIWAYFSPGCRVASPSPQLTQRIIQFEQKYHLFPYCPVHQRNPFSAQRCGGWQLETEFFSGGISPLEHPSSWNSPGTYLIFFEASS